MISDLQVPEFREDGDFGLLEMQPGDEVARQSR